jgi:hypothetical protein
MDMQQMMQQLLAIEKANQDMLARMEANRESDREQMLTEMSTRMDTNTMADRKRDREELKGMMNATQERLDANLKHIKEKIKSGQAEIRSIICTFRSELKKTIQREMRAAIQSIWSELDEMTACNEATD